MKKIIVFISVLLLLTITTLAGLEFFSAKPPLAALEKCQNEILQAKDVEADKYANEFLLAAESLLEKARGELKVQNERLFFTRDYTTTLQFINKSLENSAEAIAKTAAKKDALHADLRKQLNSIDHKIKHFEEYYVHLPLNGNARKNFTNAKLKYVESQKAYERGAYLVVGKNLDEASRLISKSVTAAHNHLSEYFQDLSKWKRWASETIDWSAKNNAYAVVVDKFAHKCYVYKNGRIKKEFHAELGPNWIGTKLYRGDKATPEGKYYVTKKKTGKQTKYYKALLINYPNAEDKERYNNNIKYKRIPRRGIGDLIEIHGDGGKGINWTEGCVALTNNEMDVLYDMVSSNTPITIVGSLKSLQEINGK